jgi:ABC-type glutathione transport system ATPase component
MEESDLAVVSSNPQPGQVGANGSLAPDSAAILAVNDLVKVYGGGRGPGRQEEVRALAGLSFSVTAGEFLP